MPPHAKRGNMVVLTSLCTSHKEKVRVVETSWTLHILPMKLPFHHQLCRCLTTTLSSSLRGVSIISLPSTNQLRTQRVELMGTSAVDSMLIRMLFSPCSERSRIDIQQYLDVLQWIHCSFKTQRVELMGMIDQQTYTHMMQKQMIQSRKVREVWLKFS